MDLPAAMDLAVRTELAQAACGATGSGLRFLDANPGDRAMSVHDADSTCLGGLCFDDTSSPEQGGSGAERGASSAGGGAAGGGGGAAPAGGRPGAGGRGHASVFAPPLVGTPPRFAAAPPGNGRGSRPPFAGGDGLGEDVPGSDELPGSAFAVSEPTTLVLLGAGLIAAAIGSRRRRERRD